ncbi:MAG: hypothetical protein LBJ67_12560 [Planctomycetaceae bacterium]|jgi:hypothetical protein|nr:hypothetical protein [Planctomycetaceae bacterium]
MAWNAYRKNRFILLIIAVICIAMAENRDLPAQETPRQNVNFRIDNRIITDNHVVNGVTIFYNNVVYDCLGEHGAITIYDRRNGTMTLLDPSCRLQTQFKISELTKEAEKRKEACLKSNNFFLNYLAAPYFEDEQYEAESGIMIFRSPWIEYRFETVRLDDAGISERYYDFCRQLTLLNIRVSRMPSPMIRAVLNPTLERHQRFPGKVSMTLYPKGKIILAGSVFQVETTHAFVRRLQPTDENRVRQAKKFQELFRELPPDDYLLEIDGK